MIPSPSMPLNTIESTSFDMEDLLKEIAFLIRNRTAVDALNALIARAPEDVKEKAKKLFDDPKVVEELDGMWADVLALIYYAHLSRYSSQLTTRQGIAGQVVSSLTAAKLSRKLEIPELEAIFLLSGAKGLTLMGMKDRAEVCYLKAEEILRDLVKRDESFLKELADVLNDLGIIYVEMNEKEKGEKYLEEALRIRRSLAEKDESYLPVLAQTLNNLASLYKDTKRYDKADELFDEAEKIYRKLVEGDENYIIDLAVVLCNYGALCRVIREFEKAEALYKEALEIFKKLTEKDVFYNSGVADVLMYLSGLYRDKGEFDKAEEYMKMANQVYNELLAKLQERSEASSGA